MVADSLDQLDLCRLVAVAHVDAESVGARRHQLRHHLAAVARWPQCREDPDLAPARADRLYQSLCTPLLHGGHSHNAAPFNRLKRFARLA
jgi:hypothetical protein